MQRAKAALKERMDYSNGRPPATFDKHLCFISLMDSLIESVLVRCMFCMRAVDLLFETERLENTLGALGFQ